ncbi:calcium-binding protein [Kitasatospora sp. MAP5-34]|uniref:calcium-binding protein n=1 Tax=Kitasatospora sp. MAP5-34 TaxID=3035102 RepID=UPI002476CA97|nr:calcium-binding protein [Kitasatospora sp. MAP5-34]MDH6580612.1 hypothetical protein [Kitasatospora sp. MAP5-34]
MSTMSRAQLEAMASEATVDCYGEDEELSGWHAMIEEHLAVPFETVVLGVEVVVEEIDLRGSQIVAVCSRGAHRQVIGILDLPLPSPVPEGAEWIEALCHWAS